MLLNNYQIYDFLLFGIFPNILYMDFLPLLLSCLIVPQLRKTRPRVLKWEGARDKDEKADVASFHIWWHSSLNSFSNIKSHATIRCRVLFLKKRLGRKYSTWLVITCFTWKSCVMCSNSWTSNKYAWRMHKKQLSKIWEWPSIEPEHPYDCARTVTFPFPFPVTSSLFAMTISSLVVSLHVT